MESPNRSEVVKAVKLCVKIILENGGETYRAEETVNRICRACGYEESDVFATPTGVFLSVSKAGEASETCVIRIRKRGVDLQAIDCVNTISRWLTAGRLDIGGAMKALQAIGEKGRRTCGWPPSPPACPRGFSRFCSGAACSIFSPPCSAAFLYG